VSPKRSARGQSPQNNSPTKFTFTHVKRDHAIFVVEPNSDFFTNNNGTNVDIFNERQITREESKITHEKETSPFEENANKNHMKSDLNHDRKSDLKDAKLHLKHEFKSDLKDAKRDLKNDPKRDLKIDLKRDLKNDLKRDLKNDLKRDLKNDFKRDLKRKGKHDDEKRNGKRDVSREIKKSPIGKLRKSPIFNIEITSSSSSSSSHKNDRDLPHRNKRLHRPSSPNIPSQPLHVDLVYTPSSLSPNSITTPIPSSLSVPSSRLPRLTIPENSTLTIPSSHLQQQYLCTQEYRCPWIPFTLHCDEPVEVLGAAHHSMNWVVVQKADGSVGFCPLSFLRTIESLRKMNSTNVSLLPPIPPRIRSEVIQPQVDATPLLTIVGFGGMTKSLKVTPNVPLENIERELRANLRVQGIAAPLIEVCLWLCVFFFFV
jgi:hypothetical protein